MISIVLRLIILTLGVFVADYLLPGIHIDSYGAAVKAALLLGFLNIFIKPVLIIFTLPINILTLGVFTLIINGLLLWLVSALIYGFTISGFLTAVLGSIVISVLSILLNRFI